MAERPEVRLGPRWAELVFHVLAHVRATAGLAASAYDARYVAFAERQLGPARERSLGEDAQLLGALVPTHAELSRIQLLAWLFEELDPARNLGERSLAELGPDEVSDARALAQLGSRAELLWCACLLELPAFETLPEPSADVERLRSALREAELWAPALSEHVVGLVRSLGRRGRVRGRAIWVGTPETELGVSVEHLVWQASHEATVHEIGRSARGGSERDVEHAAVVRLAERARAQGKAAEHATWIAHFGANRPSIERDGLSPAARALLGPG